MYSPLNAFHVLGRSAHADRWLRRAILPACRTVRHRMHYSARLNRIVTISDRPSACACRSVQGR
ncbi:MAG: hypothetical protein AVDCRST_MAG71-1398 [uncultured Lysobacter sp.]|uniref:Uncharacterized protein n=1 Tax=uncultured Lysobacter sp. TaxID=271060 RepID=A0A6J4L4N5_9GAMM|nr:MAG: hypothetical protein AVDCRST_MAG71-1398 [uncultured Lysobacter sp.]